MILLEVTHRKEKCVIMQSGQVHPAAIRSKRLIADSLLELMINKNYSKITIKDITDSAVLTRRTFYAHFDSKEDVLNNYLSSLTGQLVEQIINIKPPDQPMIALVYFEFWMDHIELLSLMRGHQLLPILLNNFETQITEIRSLFECNCENTSHVYMYYSSAIFSSILWNVLDKWIANGARETPEDLVNILTTITRTLASSMTDEHGK